MIRARLIRVFPVLHDSMLTFNGNHPLQLANQLQTRKGSPESVVGRLVCWRCGLRGPDRAVASGIAGCGAFCNQRVVSVAAPLHCYSNVLCREM